VRGGGVSAGNLSRRLRRWYFLPLVCIESCVQR
jgi:hypothetical protein